ncbi:zf-HC2 domain-containing protein [Micromonospora sp. KC606]|nr:zf-HC2 domain-containing protein [Micromonospora sp. KC606]
MRRYGERVLVPPVLWSIEAHLAACAQCRERLAVVDPQVVRAGWARLDAELDAPVPGPVERLLVRVGVAEHTARLLAATPVLRLSWLAAVVSTLALVALLANLAHPVVFLATAPLLPVGGVALSFGPRVDPTYEITVVAPMHTFRLLLLRCVAVLSATTALSAAASLALPDYGLVALGWFLPALALTLLSLALTPRLGPVLAAASVGLGWIALVTSTLGVGSGGSAVFVPAGQLALALAGALAALVLARIRRAFETPRRFW